MIDWVEITASARLHLGFFDLNGGLGRRFGSLGLALDRPVTSLAVRRGPAALGTGLEAQRAAEHLAKLRRHWQLAADYDVKVHQAIPAHAGLGSGTQLALAVATALRVLEGRRGDAAVDAILLQRGARSGAGAALFRSGGLVVDGGHAEQLCADEACVDTSGQSGSVPPVLVRYDFPEEWRVLLVTDPATQGVHGAEEREAFAKLPRFPAAHAAEICRAVLMQALPGLVERDLAAFGAAITRIQHVLGDYFAPAQGGSRFTSARVGAIMRQLESHGAQGVGQSSWGPSGFAFAASVDEAERLVKIVADAAASANLNLIVCKAANQGAIIRSGSNHH